MIGAVHLSGGFDASAPLVHLLFDPLIEAASALGAGLDWKTSLQELSAERGLGVPEYVIQDEGPDHMKTFTAQVRVGDDLYGNGVGRSKKEAEQAAAETAYGELVAGLEPSAEPRPSRRLTESADRPCPSCPRSRSSAPASSATSSAPRSSASRCSTRARSAATRAGPTGFAAALTGRRVEAARRRGKYFWLALDNGDALLGHLGHERPDAGPAGRRARRPPPARPVPPRSGPGFAGTELRFADQRMFGGLLGLRGRRRAAVGDRPHRPRPARPGVRRRRVRTPRARRRSGIKRQLLDQTLVSGRRQHLRRRGAVAGQVHGERRGDRLGRAQVRELLGHAREVMVAALGEGGTSFDALYVNVNGQSGYFDRSLHAYGRRASPCDRCGTPMRRVAFMNRSSYFCPVCQPPPRRAAVLTGHDQWPREIDLTAWSVTLEDGPPRSGCHP